MKLGIFSDIHQRPGNLAAALEFFSKEKVDLILGAGDLSNAPRHLEFVVHSLTSTKRPAVLFPGSHESLSGWYEAFKGTPPHIIDGVKQRKMSFDDFDLVLLPGSEFLAGGEFLLTDQGRARFEDNLYKISINDLDELVTRPEKTIVAGHNPPRFRSPQGVDQAFFGERKGEIIPGYDGAYYNRILGVGEQFNLREENKGFRPLTEKIKTLFPHQDEKMVTAHFHESTHKAIDRQENPVPEGVWVRNLYHLASNLDLGRVGIWETRTRGEVLEVKYKNVSLSGSVENEG